jgi:hypothetical protein
METEPLPSTKQQHKQRQDKEEKEDKQYKQYKQYRQYIDSFFTRDFLETYFHEKK